MTATIASTAMAAIGQQRSRSPGPGTHGWSAWIRSASRRSRSPTSQMSSPAAIGTANAPTAVSAHASRAMSRPTGRTRATDPRAMRTMPPMPSPRASCPVRRAGSRSGWSSVSATSERRIRPAQRAPATTAMHAVMASASRASAAMKANDSSSGVVTRSGSIRPLRMAAARTAIAPRARPTAPPKNSTQRSPLPPVVGGCDGRVGETVRSSGGAGIRSAGSAGVRSSRVRSYGGSAPIAGLVGRAGQCPPCPASTALRCSAMTFSARCDGTSS